MFGNVFFFTISLMVSNSKSLFKFNAQFLAMNVIKVLSIKIIEDEYFDEFIAFINILQDKLDDCSKNKKMLMYQTLLAVEFAFCLPGSNASIERVFSLMTTTWTDVRNQMDTKTIECCLVTKIYGLSCIAFYNEIIKNPTLLKKIHSTEKYKVSLDEKNKEI
ncbi:hypothetical protein QTP88_019006 [Uroleucon formosanum]